MIIKTSLFEKYKRCLRMPYKMNRVKYIQINILSLKFLKARTTVTTPDQRRFLNFLEGIPSRFRRCLGRLVG